MQYQYVQLGRLIRAETTNANWGLAWNYDGFGNLTQQSVIKGSLTGFTLGINGAKNRITGQNYDANGNWTGTFGQSQSYDVENRVRTATSHYHQEPTLFRPQRTHGPQRDQDRHRVHFYSADGLLLAFTPKYAAEPSTPARPPRRAGTHYFGGRHAK